MERDAERVPELRIARQLGVTPADRPLLDSVDQRPADTALAKLGVDEPALEIRHRRDRSTVDVIAPERDLSEPDEVRLVVLGDEHDAVGLQELVDFELVFLLRTIRPQRVPQAKPGVAVVRPRFSNAWDQR
jgi:hypothetical protein